MLPAPAKMMVYWFIETCQRQDFLRRPSLNIFVESSHTPRLGDQDSRPTEAIWAGCCRTGFTANGSMPKSAQPWQYKPSPALTSSYIHCGDRVSLQYTAEGGMLLYVHTCILHWHDIWIELWSYTVDRNDTTSVVTVTNHLTSMTWIYDLLA